MTTRRIEFLIGGVQKAGTSALARYLDAHPRLALPADKEAHVFDAPEFDSAWSAADVERMYGQRLPAPRDGVLGGDATPIYVFLPQAIERIRRYNAAMRWIVILRDPVERALSHYHMERKRRNEQWPLWAAMLLEHWRLAGSEGDLSEASPLRRHSYRARSDYAAQLDTLYRNFPREQVLLLTSRALRMDPARVLARVWSFLGIEAPQQAPAPSEVFVGDYDTPGWATRRLMGWLLRRERLAMQERYGLRFDDDPAAPSA